MISQQFIRRVTLKRETVETFDRYPFSLPAIRSLQHIDLHPDVTFFVGENGSGLHSTDATASLAHRTNSLFCSTMACGTS